MQSKMRFGRRCLLTLLAGLFCACYGMAGAQQLKAVSPSSTRVAASISSSSISNVRLERMLLLLQSSATEQKSLKAWLAAQQTPGNASFHQWLTPAQFADRFGLSASDAATVAAWLHSQGFAVAPLPAGRGWIEFSGTLSQTEQAFGAQLKAISTASGETRYEFAGPPVIPAAIAGKVQGLVSLDGVLSAAAATVPMELGESADTLAAETSLTRAQSLTPSIEQSWLHLSPLYAAGITGAGESIAIPARSNVRQADFAAFRKTFGLPDSTLDIAITGADPTLDSALDPGRTSDEGATILAASWAGVAAPQASIVLVPAASTNATDGIDLALAVTVDQALAHTVSIGYSACESSMSPAHQAFYAAVYAQAAAEGIAIVAATGDSGAAACHSPLDPNPVSSGWGVNGLASTPWNTAVGAVGFTADGRALTAWQSPSAPESIPTPTAALAYATGGGASTIYATPAWQSAAGVPASDPAVRLHFGAPTLPARRELSGSGEFRRQPGTGLLLRGRFRQRWLPAGNRWRQ
jgi:subtilase family serine protease